MVLALEDELMPPTPAPRLLTPRAGVPLPAGNAPLSGPHAAVVENALNKELSGQHQATRFLYEFPREPDNQASAAQAGPDKAEGWFAGVGAAAAHGWPNSAGLFSGLWGKTRSLGLGCGLLCGWSRAGGCWASRGARVLCGLDGHASTHHAHPGVRAPIAHACRQHPSCSRLLLPWS